MKKKILLSLVIVSMLVCLFAITASAIDVDGIDYTFSGTEASISSANKSFAKENVIIPATVTYEGATYTVTKIDSDAFYGNTTIKTLTFENIANIVSIGGSAFRDCTALTGTYNFSGLTSIGWNAFRNSATAEDSYLALNLPKIQTIGGSGGDTHVFSYSGLREIYIGNTINAINLNSFTQCTKLWRIEMQSGVKETFSFASYTFESCTALKAFSIPEGVKKLPNRMFSGCTSLKAVYLPSTLEEINSGAQSHSTFYNCTNMYFVSKPFTFTSDEDIPAKEDVYYFPLNLTKITSETFKACQSLNKTLVFQEGITSVNDAWAFEAAINNPTLENIVFLGDMDKISTGSWRLTGKIYFANPNDKSSADFSSYSNSKSTVFCNAKGNTEHLAEKVVDVPAQCEIDAGKVTYCFCGHEISKVPVEGTALSHDYDYVNNENAKLIKIEYSDYAKVGTKTVACALCGKENGVEAEALFTFKGYSTDNENQICVGYLINQKAIEEYKANGGAEFSYGFVASANNNTPLALTDKTVNIDLTLEKYSALDFKISGEWSDSNQSTALLSMNIYTKLGENISYVYGYKDEDGKIISQSYDVADQISYSSMNP